MRKLKVVPDRWNYSQTRSYVQAFFGSAGRVWQRDGAVQIGLEVGARKLVLVSAGSFEEAIRVLFVNPMKERLALTDEVKARAGQEPSRE